MYFIKQCRHRRRRRFQNETGCTDDDRSPLSIHSLSAAPRSSIAFSSDASSATPPPPGFCVVRLFSSVRFSPVPWVPGFRVVSVGQFGGLMILWIGDFGRLTICVDLVGLGFDELTIWWVNDLVSWGFDGLTILWVDELVGWWFGRFMIWWVDDLVGWWFGGPTIYWVDDSIGRRLDSNTTR